MIQHKTFTYNDLQELEQMIPWLKSRIENGRFVFDESTKNIGFAYLGNNEDFEESDIKLVKELTEIVFNTPQPKLKYLNAGFCKLKQIVIKNCPSLQALYLNNNQLETIRFDGVFKELETIVLDRNQLTELDLPTEQFPELKFLFLYKNQFTDLSHLAGFFTNKKFDLNVDKNEKLSKPPVEILEKGRGKVRNWYEQIIAQGTDYIYEAKMLIVGEGGSGKTTLARKIDDPESPLPSEDHRTRGIHILDHYFDVDSRNEPGKRKNFRLNVWDFGGQDNYYSTHRFFLTKRSLYVLVADNRKDNTHFDYWLDITRMFAGESPMIIVLNEKDDVKSPKDLSGERARFDNIKDVISLNFKTCEETDTAKRKQRLKKIYDLIALIENISSRLPHIGAAVPARWVNIRRAISAHPKPFITLKQFRELCGEHHITKAEDIETLSGYFHDLGVLLHYSEDDLLKKTVILKPSWATNAVYRVFDHDSIKAKNGRFTKQDARDIWCEAEYCDMHAELFAMMHKFRLAYMIEGTEKLVAPSMLCPEKPEYEWDGRQNLQLHYKYEVFMPEGILSNAIVMLHKYIKQDDKQNDLVWKNGVVLERHETFAEIYTRPNIHQVFIRLYGKDIKGLLSHISDTIEEINGTYHNLKVEKLVPCNCETCKDTEEPHFYHHSKLIQRKETGKQTIECGNPPYQDVNVLALLEAVDTQKRESAGGMKFPVFPEKQVIRDKVFISYSHKDSQYLEKVRNNLKVLQSEGIEMNFWDDTLIKPGEKWLVEIERNLASAKVAILLVSTDFLISDFITKKEIPALLKAAEIEGATIIPLVVRPCRFKQNQVLSQFQAVYNPSKALSDHTENDQEHIILKLMDRIAELFDEK